MSSLPHCCNATSSVTGTGVRADGSSHSGTLWRRLVDFVKWITPGGVLVLLPKCPMCIAAYVAMGTGVGISISTASFLRTGLVALCLVSLSYLLARAGRRWTSRIWRY